MCRHLRRHSSDERNSLSGCQNDALCLYRVLHRCNRGGELGTGDGLAIPQVPPSVAQEVRQTSKEDKKNVLTQHALDRAIFTSSGNYVF